MSEAARREDEIRRRECAQAHAGEVVEGSGVPGKPARKAHMVSVRLEPELFTALTRLAAAKGISLSDFLREGARLAVADSFKPKATYRISGTAYGGEGRTGWQL